MAETTGRAPAPKGVAFGGASELIRTDSMTSGRSRSSTDPTAGGSATNVPLARSILKPTAKPSHPGLTRVASTASMSSMNSARSSSSRAPTGLHKGMAGTASVASLLSAAISQSSHEASRAGSPSSDPEAHRRARDQHVKLSRAMQDKDKLLAAMAPSVGLNRTMSSVASRASLIGTNGSNSSARGFPMAQPMLNYKSALAAELEAESATSQGSAGSDGGSDSDSDTETETVTWREFFQSIGIVSTKEALGDIKETELTRMIHQNPQQYYGRVFLAREIDRLQLRTDYVQAVGDLRSLDRSLLPGASSQEAERIIKMYNVIKRFTLDEVFLNRFIDAGEVQWSVMMLKTAMDLREFLAMEVEQMPEPEINRMAKLTENVRELRAIFTRSEEFLDRMEVAHRNNWLIMADLALLYDIASPENCVAASLEKIEIIDLVMRYAPDEDSTAKSRPFLALWESQTKEIRNIITMQDASDNGRDHIFIVLNAMRSLPPYIPEDHPLLRAMWDSLLTLLYQYEKEQGNNSIEDQSVARRGKPSKTKVRKFSVLHFLAELHLNVEEQWRVTRTENEAIGDVYPLFSLLCQHLAGVHMRKKNYQHALKYAAQKLVVDLDGANASQSSIMQSWSVVHQAVKLGLGPAETFEFLKTTLTQCSAFENRELLDRIKYNIFALRLSNFQDVTYYEKYTAQLSNVTQRFYGHEVESHELSEALGEILEKLLDSSKAHGSDESDMMASGLLSPQVEVATIHELKLLMTINVRFAKKMFRKKAYRKSKQILVETLRMEHVLNQTQTRDKIKATPALFNMLATSCMELAKQEELTAAVLPCPAAFAHLRDAWKARPPHIAASNTQLVKLYDEIMTYKGFRREFLEDEYTNYYWARAALTKLNLDEGDVDNQASLMLQIPREKHLRLSPDQVTELDHKFPMISRCLLKLGEIYSAAEQTKAGLVVLVECLYWSAQLLDRKDSFTIKVWDKLVALCQVSQNPFEFLALLDSMYDTLKARSVPDKHPLYKRIETARKQSQKNQQNNLKYMYQIRYNEEMTGEMVPSALYSLNQEFAVLFEQHDALPEAIELVINTLDMFRRAESLDMVGHYLSAWHYLCKLHGKLALIKEEHGLYNEALQLHQTSLDYRPVALDPQDENLEKIVTEILRIFNTDPATAPGVEAIPTETASFFWLEKQFNEYDKELTEVYPTESLLNLDGLLQETWNSKPARVKAEHLEQFKLLLLRYPYIMIVCKEIAMRYYVAHELELATHISRHAVHIMTLVPAPDSSDIRNQWRLTQKYFISERHTYQERVEFIAEELVIAKAMLKSTHPRLAQLNEEHSRASDKAKSYEKYGNFISHYILYAGIIYLLVDWIPVAVNDWADFWNGSRIWLFLLFAYLQMCMVIPGLYFAGWPKLPETDKQRTLHIIKRSVDLRDTALIIACHRSEDVIGQTLRAALKIFPAESIWIVDTGNYPVPLDKTEQVVKRVCTEYHRSHSKTGRASMVHYNWISQHSPLLGYWWTIHHVCNTQNVMLIDDTTLLPHDMLIPVEHLSDEYPAIQFVRCASNMKTTSGRTILFSLFVDMELKLDGFVKQFHSTIGGNLEVDAPSLWRRDILEEVLYNHNAMDRGAGIQAGLMLQRLNINCQASTNPSTCPTSQPPRRLWRSPDGRSWVQQTVWRWYPNNHRLVFDYLLVLLFFWKRHTINLKPWILYHLLVIFQDFTIVPLGIWFAWNDWYTMAVGMAGAVVVHAALLYFWNAWVFRFRPDMKVSTWVVVFYPLYYLIILIFRYFAAYHHLFYYAAVERVEKKLSRRMDLPPGPSDIVLLEAAKDRVAKLRSVHNEAQALEHQQWKSIADKLNSQHITVSPPMTHWLFDCVAKLGQPHARPLIPMPADGPPPSADMLNPAKSLSFLYLAGRGNSPAAHGFYAALDAMSWLAGKPRVLGADTDIAVAALRWAWLDYHLARDSRGIGPVQIRVVEDRLDELRFTGMKPIHMAQLMTRVAIPTVREIYPAIHPNTFGQILHLVPHRFPGASGWGLQQFPMNLRRFEVADEDTAIAAAAPDAPPLPPSSDKPTGPVASDYGKGSIAGHGVDTSSPFLLLIPVSVSQKVTSYAMALVSPVHRYMLLVTWPRSQINLSCELYTVLYLLKKQEKQVPLEQYTLLKTNTENAISPISWTTVTERALQYMKVRNPADGGARAAVGALPIRRRVFGSIGFGGAPNAPGQGQEWRRMSVVAQSLQRTAERSQDSGPSKSYNERARTSWQDPHAYPRLSIGSRAQDSSSSNKDCHATSLLALLNSDFTLRVPGCIGPAEGQTTCVCEGGSLDLSSGKALGRRASSFALDNSMDWISLVTDSGFWLHPMLQVLPHLVVVLSPENKIVFIGRGSEDSEQWLLLRLQKSAKSGRVEMERIDFKHTSLLPERILEHVASKLEQQDD